MKTSEWNKRIDQWNADCEFRMALETRTAPYLEPDPDDDDLIVSPTTTNDRLITLKELINDYVPMDRTTVWRMVKAGTFPRPLRIASRLRWRLSMIQKWFDDLERQSQRR